MHPQRQPLLGVGDLVVGRVEVKVTGSGVVTVKNVVVVTAVTTRHSRGRADNTARVINRTLK